MLHRYILIGLGKNGEGSQLGVLMDFVVSPTGNECKTGDGCSKSNFFSFIYRGPDLDPLIKIRKFGRVLLFVIKINNTCVS